MRYKTTIHIIADARDRNEAVEMADEYLAGHLASGIDMKCSTRPVYQNTVKVVSAVAVSALVLLAILIVPQSRHAAGMIPAVAGASAIQPPLKTSSADRLSTEFKKEWQVRQTAEALNVIRQ
jgi:hypothetical protein